jgi:hypothetical protein
MKKNYLLVLLILLNFNTSCKRTIYDEIDDIVDSTDVNRFKKAYKILLDYKDKAENYHRWMDNYEKLKKNYAKNEVKLLSKKYESTKIAILTKNDDLLIFKGLTSLETTEKLSIIEGIVTSSLQWSPCNNYIGICTVFGNNNIIGIYELHTKKIKIVKNDRGDIRCENPPFWSPGGGLFACQCFNIYTDNYFLKFYKSKVYESVARIKINRPIQVNSKIIWKSDTEDDIFLISNYSHKHRLVEFNKNTGNIKPIKININKKFCNELKLKNCLNQVLNINIFNMSYNSNTQRLALGVGGDTIIFDLKKNKVIDVIKFAYFPSFSPDGKYILFDKISEIHLLPVEKQDRLGDFTIFLHKGSAAAWSY